MADDTEKTEEILLLSYSPVIHDVALKDLVRVLELTVTIIDGEICALGDIRVDEENHRIYGRGHKLKELEEYR
jgi:hypothetical protein